ncbi:ABC transporter ATP-binding protein [Nocardioides bruguierae]|uniref:ATP-binding cassette domain-containing protein n=1 Tax=Nocardioides bruguierae TaxID=2945102 RepID=A0A9X2D7R2_9ACTN|nr:ATP-binding cassette domain-containing protein [Nocardioides bruguierae]MCM0620921.1 ATP-binding cassette domain-containing protein [Nocardioides bruguierae]
MSTTEPTTPEQTADQKNAEQKTEGASGSPLAEQPVAAPADLVVTGVTHEAGRRTLLADVEVRFPAGSMTALSGPSGSGKTTLLSVAGGLLRPTAGSATHGAEPTWTGTGDPRPDVAFVLQVYGLVPVLSAAENVSVALRARGVAPEAADEQALAALARFGIADLGARQVEELSGGQMQRVALARGLAVGAAVLLADEPTSELDETNRGHVLAELRREADRGAVVVVATHDPAVVEACDGHVALDDGRVVLDEAAEAPQDRSTQDTSATDTPATDTPATDTDEAAPGEVPPVEGAPVPEAPAAAAEPETDDDHAAFRRPPGAP